jgi:CheY-like chemotaxis protein
MQLQVIDVNVVIGDIESMLRRLIGEDIQLHTSLGKLVDNIHVDPGQLEQVLVNLVVNARDAMPSGGLLSISTSNSTRSDDPDVLAECADGHYVVLTVTDTGIGMTEEIQRRIFDPFFTTKEQGRGTGLGLSTAYGIVKQSGGEISVFSQTGKGSTFKVYFPCFTSSTEPRPLVAKPPESPRGTETILLVEDDSTVRTLAERILKKCGYEVLVACEGAEALTIASDSRTMIDAVVTDFVMPGMNGRQLVEKLLELRPEIASLLMSGYNDDKTLHRGVQDGDTAFLQKPFSPDQLARKVSGVLDRVSS